MKNHQVLYIYRILKTLRLLLLPVFAIFNVSTLDSNYRFADNDKTEVLVVGTIHQLHSIDTNYTYYDILNILDTYNPSAVCVEIRPEEFRKELYLQEMTLAVIWAINNNKKVYPIDWWLNDTRHLRDSLMKLPEYKQKEKKVEEAAESNSIITNFEKKYGTRKEQSRMGYEFWNGKEYNEYTMENYRLWTDAFGDSPITLYYKTRNDSMMARILSVIHENRGGKIIVLTGSEHKHYFDNSLMRNPDVSLIEFGSILPLTKKEPDPVISAFFEESNDLPYFEEGYPENINDYYSTKLIPLLHGPGMDEYPEKVPVTNINISEKIIDRWKNDTNSSAALDKINFELGWLQFLKRDFRDAIENLLPLSKRIESGIVTDPFLTALTHRNLGFCYDCIGERDSAVTCYRQGENFIGGTFFGQAKELLFKDYITQPYNCKKD